MTTSNNDLASASTETVPLIVSSVTNHSKAGEDLTGEVYKAPILRLLYLYKGDDDFCWFGHTANTTVNRLGNN
jgi:hypothetical protein